MRPQLLLTVDACIAFVQLQSLSETDPVNCVYSVQRVCLDLYKTARRTADNAKRQSQDMQNVIMRLERENQILRQKSQVALQRAAESERVRRQSIKTLHHNLFARLIEAEAEHEEEVERFRAANWGHPCLPLGSNVPPYFGIPIIELLPRKLVGEQRIIYERLFRGYTREMEYRYAIRIASPIVRIISEYYPWFL